jgi:hypothetical protein
MVVATMALLVTPTPAQAHPPAQQIPDAAYYRAELVGVAPRVSGIRVQVDPAGEWFELTNAGPTTVVILGYTGEPYLRISSDRAEENLLSQTTYLNRSMFADSVPAAAAQGTSSMAPAWQELKSTGKARWHDHRIHWMGQTRPPMVVADPTRPHLIGTWTVHATADGSPFDITGTLSWLGKPATASTSSLQTWLLTALIGLVVAVIVLLIALIRSRRRGRSEPTETSEKTPKTPSWALPQETRQRVG